MGIENGWMGILINSNHKLTAFLPQCASNNQSAWNTAVFCSSSRTSFVFNENVCISLAQRSYIIQISLFLTSVWLSRVRKWEKSFLPLIASLFIQPLYTSAALRSPSGYWYLLQVSDNSPSPVFPLEGKCFYHVGKVKASVFSRKLPPKKV